MNKKKSFMLAFLAAVSVFSLAFAIGCTDNGNDGGGTNNGDNTNIGGNGSTTGDEDVIEAPASDWILQSISLDVSGIKTAYAYGEDFDTNAKPVVKAKLATLESVLKYEETKYLLAGTAELVTEDRTVTEFKIDAGQYDKNAVGTYNIYISYTFAGITRSAYYPVTVQGVTPEIGGITVETDADFRTSYAFGSDGKVTITGLDKVHVYSVNANLEKGAEIPASECTVEYYFNGTKIDSIENLTRKGDYTIMYKHNNAAAFVVVQLGDDLTGIAVKTDAAGAKFTQVQSPVDEMTSTWVFTVTYVSGATKDVKIGDVGVTAGSVVTVTAGADRKVAVGYSEDGITKTIDVTYNVTANENLKEQVSELKNISTLKFTDKDGAFTADDFKGDNSFITPLTNLRHRSSNAAFLDFNGNALTITTNGFGTLVIGARSTGSANTSGIYLADEEGKYITGYFAENQGISLSEQEEGFAVLVSDAKTTSYKKITFILPEAGTYKLGSLAVGTDTVNQEWTRFDSLVLTDVFDKNVDIVSYELTLDTAAVKKDYVAGETTLSKEGLTATLTEVHTVDPDTKNRTTDLTADDLTLALTAGDLTKRNTEGTVTVTYIKDGKAVTATYKINIKSPVAIDGTDVNSVALVKETATYNLAQGETTVEIDKTDIVLHANKADGAEITLGDGESVVYKLYKGNEELDGWTVETGTYTIKATVTLKNTKSAVEGTTVFEAEIAVAVKAYVAPGGTETKTADLTFDSEKVPTAAITDSWEWYSDTDGNKVSVVASTGSTVTIDTNGKKVDSSSNNLTHRIKLGGAGTTEYRSIKLELAYDTTVTLYVLSSSSKDGDERTVQLLDSDGAAVDLTQCAKVNGEAYTATTKIAGSYTGDTQTIIVLEITLEAGTYYFGSTSGGLNVHGGKISYEVESESGGETETPAKEPISISFNGLTAGDLTAETKIMDDTSYLSNVKILATDTLKDGTTDYAQQVTVVTEANTVNGVDTTNYIKTNGTSKATYRSVSFTLDEGNYKVTVYAKSGKSGATDRFVQLFDGNDNPKAETATGDSISGFSFNVTGGTYQVGSSNSGMSIYLIVIEPVEA